MERSASKSRQDAFGSLLEALGKRGQVNYLKFAVHLVFHKSVTWMRTGALSCKVNPALLICRQVKAFGHSYQADLLICTLLNLYRLPMHLKVGSLMADFVSKGFHIKFCSTVLMDVVGQSGTAIKLSRYSCKPYRATAEGGYEFSKDEEDAFRELVGAMEIASTRYMWVVFACTAFLVSVFAYRYSYTIQKSRVADHNAHACPFCNISPQIGAGGSSAGTSRDHKKFNGSFWLIACDRHPQPHRNSCAHAYW